MIKKRLFIPVFLGILALTAPASAELVTIIHGLPALPGVIPSYNPIDIAIDGECTHIYKLFGSKTGPIEMAAGTHSIVFYESALASPCRGTVLGALEGVIPEGGELDVVLGLDAEDQVAVKIFNNKTSLAALENGMETGVEVRSVAAGPTLGAIVKKDLEQVHAGEVAAGAFLGPLGSTPGDHTVQVNKGEEVLDLVTGNFERGRVYWIYICGSVFKKTVDLLSIQSIPDEPVEDEPPTEPAKFSTCCFYGAAAQLGEAQCQKSGGRYIGDVDPLSNPCQGVN